MSDALSAGGSEAEVLGLPGATSVCVVDDWRGLAVPELSLRQAYGPRPMTRRIRQAPRLLRGAMTGAVYVVTRYEVGPGGVVRAHEKFDVTEDYQRVKELEDLDTDPPDCDRLV